MNRPDRDRRSAPPARASGFFPVLRPSTVEQAQAVLDRGGQVLVVSTCAVRALMALGLSPARYDAYDAGAVDRTDALNGARFYRVRARLPEASR
jgi:hypothetical protein